MNYITLLTLIITAAYLWYIGIIPSISDSHRTKERKLFYHLFFTASCALIMLQGLYVDYYVWYLLAGFLFYGISVASRFWLRMEGHVHVVCTYGAITLGLALTVVRLWPIWGKLATVALVAVGISGAILLHLFLRRNKTYWLEVWAYIVIFGPLVPLYK